MSGTSPTADRYEGLETFGTPEEAALAGWRSTPAAHAWVVEIAPATEFAGVYVTVQTDGHPGFHDRDISSCVRTRDGRWFEVGGAQGMAAWSAFARVRQGDMPTTCAPSMGMSIGVTLSCCRRTRQTSEARRRKFLGSAHPERNLQSTFQDAQVSGRLRPRMRRA